MVSAGCCWILKDTSWGKQLNVTICGEKTFHLGISKISSNTNKCDSKALSIIFVPEIG